MIKHGVTAQSLFHTSSGLVEMRALALLPKPAYGQTQAQIGRRGVKLVTIPDPGKVESLGKRPVVWLITSEGFELRLEPELHLSTTERGWQPAGQLAAGERVQLAYLPKSCGIEGNRCGTGLAGRMSQGRKVAALLLSGQFTEKRMRLLRDAMAEDAPALFESSERMQRAFMQRVLDARGEVHLTPEPHVRLTLPDELRADIQLQLLNFGVFSRFSRDDGKPPALIIAGDSLVSLDAEFGFIDEERDALLGQILPEAVKSGGEGFTAQVATVLAGGGEEDVFSFAQPGIGIYAVNGFVLRNPLDRE